MQSRFDGWFAEEELTHSIIGAFFAVHNEIGFGFLESVYSAALERLLVAKGHVVGREVRIPVIFRGQRIAVQRLDMVVDGKVIVEVKATEVLHTHATRQLLGYLRATEMEVGLLFHFGRKPRFYRLASKNPDQ